MLHFQSAVQNEFSATARPMKKIYRARSTHMLVQVFGEFHKKSRFFFTLPKNVCVKISEHITKRVFSATTFIMKKINGHTILICQCKHLVSFMNFFSSLHLRIHVSISDYGVKYSFSATACLINFF